jgi:cytochrome c-type biogenesis protein CcmH/NrfG
MTVATLGVALALAAIAASGPLASLLHRDESPAEDLPSPARAHRRALLVEMDDLDGARAEGSLSAEGYAAARAGVDRRLARVDARLRPNAPSSSGVSAPRAGLARATTAGLVVVLVAVVAVPTLLSAAIRRAPGQPITGTLPSLSVPAAQQGLAALRAQVRRTPGDIDARLALARREFDGGRLGDASTQYLAVLRLDPTNPEATARLGLILGMSGRAAEGLRAIDRALRLDPGYREALLFRAILELRVLHRPGPAIRDARAFLRSPADSGGVETQTARRLLARARAARPVSAAKGSGT